MSDNLKTVLGKLADGRDLGVEESRNAFEVLMSGDATPAQIGALLMGLRVKGETVEEIEGAVQVMRSKALAVRAPDNAIDIVGTGGDGAGSFNISTATALVVSGGGVPVAKHGNRAISSRSGAADVLRELGVQLDLDASAIGACIERAGIGFMFAPNHHAAMRHVGPARAEIGTRTIFNLLGPLSNPAGVRRYLIGVFDERWIEPVAAVLKSLGSDRAIIVNGAFGNGRIDEISTAGDTEIAELENGTITRSTLRPEDFGLARVSPEALQGGDCVVNAAAIRRLLKGEGGPFRDVVLLNAAAALLVAGEATTIEDGIGQAAGTIDEGLAADALERLVSISNELAQ